MPPISADCRPIPSGTRSSGITDINPDNTFVLQMTKKTIVVVSLFVVLVIVGIAVAAFTVSIRQRRSDEFTIKLTPGSVAALSTYTLCIMADKLSADTQCALLAADCHPYPSMSTGAESPVASNGIIRIESIRPVHIYCRFFRTVGEPENEIILCANFRDGTRSYTRVTCELGKTNEVDLQNQPVDRRQ
jgi:hypothetical protein